MELNEVTLKNNKTSFEMLVRKYYNQNEVSIPMHHQQTYKRIILVQIIKPSNVPMFDKHLT